MLQLLSLGQALLSQITIDQYYVLKRFFKNIDITKRHQVYGHEFSPHVFHLPYPCGYVLSANHKNCIVYRANTNEILRGYITLHYVNRFYIKKNK